MLPVSSARAKVPGAGCSNRSWTQVSLRHYQPLQRPSKRYFFPGRGVRDPSTMNNSLQIYLPEWADGFIDPMRLFATDEERVSLAIELALRNIELGTGGPFGAAIFDERGAVMAIGVNRVLPLACSVAHAEMMATLWSPSALRR